MVDGGGDIREEDHSARCEERPSMVNNYRCQLHSVQPDNSQRYCTSTWCHTVCTYICWQGQIYSIDVTRIKWHHSLKEFKLAQKLSGGQVGRYVFILP